MTLPMNARRRPYPLAVIGVLLVALLACSQEDGSQPITAAQAAKLQAGMMRGEVLSLLGNPKVRSDDVWTYVPREGPYDRIDITFENEKVTTLHTNDRR